MGMGNTGVEIPRRAAWTAPATHEGHTTRLRGLRHGAAVRNRCSTGEEDPAPDWGHLRGLGWGDQVRNVSGAPIRHSSLVIHLGDFMGRVVVVGSINTDLVARTRSLPRPGETLLGSTFATVGGGKGANTATAAARLGAAVAFVGCLGTDDLGTARLADLRREGIDVALIRRTDAAPSGVALIVVDDAGENTIVVVPGTNALVGPEAVAELTLTPDDVVLTQLEIPLPTVEAALRRARAVGARTILNTAPFDPAVAPLLPLVDLLIVNEVEGADFLGWERIEAATAAAAARAILARGPGVVALTLGKQGAFIGQGDSFALLAAPPVAVVDTTAAGDAFAGALAAGLAAAWSFRAATERAVRVGSLTVTKAGAQPSLPYAAELAGRGE